MGGSANPSFGRPSGAGGGGVSGGNPCADFDETLRIISPIPSVVAALKIGDRLAVVLEGDEIHVVRELEKGAPEKAGALLPSEPDVLKACLEAGVKFSAEVQSRLGGACIVRVRAGAA